MFGHREMQVVINAIRELVAEVGTTPFAWKPPVEITALETAVRCALVLEKPLLVRGEPGTGKTLLAEAVAEALGMELITWNVKSTTRAQEGLYTYDTVQRLYDSRFGDHNVQDIADYIHLGPMGRAFSAEQRVVLLGGAMLAASGIAAAEPSAADKETAAMVEAIDGPISLNECSNPDGNCSFGEDCQLKEVWCDAQEDLVNRLKATNFAQFASPN